MSSPSCWTGCAPRERCDRNDHPSGQPRTRYLRRSGGNPSWRLRLRWHPDILGAGAHGRNSFRYQPTQTSSNTACEEVVPRGHSCRRDSDRLLHERLAETFAVSELITSEVELQAARQAIPIVQPVGPTIAPKDLRPKQDTAEEFRHGHRCDTTMPRSGVSGIPRDGRVTCSLIPASPEHGFQFRQRPDSAHPSPRPSCSNRRRGCHSPRISCAVALPERTAPSM